MSMLEHIVRRSGKKLLINYAGLIRATDRDFADTVADHVQVTRISEIKMAEDGNVQVAYFRCGTVWHSFTESQGVLVYARQRYNGAVRGVEWKHIATFKIRIESYEDDDEEEEEPPVVH